MALSNPFNPPPNTQIVKDNPTSDSIWRRWFEQLWKRIQTGALGGTVTSVGLSLPTSVFDVTGSPVTTSGTLAATFDTQSANTAFMGPTTGAAATPAFRTLVAADIPTDAVITVGVTPIASGTATRVLYEGAGNLLAEDADLTFDGTTLTAGGLSVTGNTTLGDAAGDTVTYNAAAWAYANNWTAARAIGAAAAGVVNAATWNTTFTGNAAGTTQVRALNIDLTGSGGNAVTANQTLLVNSRWSGSATCTTVQGMTFQSFITSSGNVTNLRGAIAALLSQGAGNVTTAEAFQVASPTFSSTGTFTTCTGLRILNQGNSLVTTAQGVNVENFTGSTNMRGIRLQLSSGSGKFNIYADGTADSVHAGNVRIGSTTAPAASLDIIQGTLGNAIQILATTATNDDPNEITYQNKVTTTDATVTTIATIAIPSSTTVFIEAKVVARRTGGAAGTAEDGAAYMVDAVYKNVAGTATEIGETSIFSAEDQAGWDCTITPSGANALVQVTGAASNNVSWLITYRTYSVSS